MINGFNVEFKSNYKHDHLVNQLVVQIKPFS